MCVLWTISIDASNWQNTRLWFGLFSTVALSTVFFFVMRIWCWRIYAICGNITFDYDIYKHQFGTKKRKIDAENRKTFAGLNLVLWHWRNWTRSIILTPMRVFVCEFYVNSRLGSNPKRISLSLQSVCGHIVCHYANPNELIRFI